MRNTRKESLVENRPPRPEAERQTKAGTTKKRMVPKKVANTLFTAVTTRTPLQQRQTVVDDLRPELVRRDAEIAALKQQLRVCKVAHVVELEALRNEDDPGEASERESIAPSFTPRREGEVRLDPSAPPQNNPESPNDEFEPIGEEPYRVYFARGKNLIVLKGRLEDEEEPCVLVCASNKFLYHRAGVAGALRERAGPKFQEESYKIMQRRKSPVKTGDVLLQKIGGPNGKPVMHAIGHEKGQRSDIEEELTAMLTLDGIIDQICLLSRENNYHTVAMPIISGEIFGFNDVVMGVALVNTLRRKTDRTEWPRMWMVCHPDASVLRTITDRVNEDQTAGEGSSDQRNTARQEQQTAAQTRVVEEEPIPDYPILRRTTTSRGKKNQIENPFYKSKLGDSFETFQLGKGLYRPTHAKSKKAETNLDRERQWNAEYAPGITCGQLWSLLNGGDAAAVLSDASLTQRAKRAILAQKDLTNKAALERLVRKGVGDEVFEEYYSDPGPESESSDSEHEEEDDRDSAYEELILPRERTPRNVTPIPKGTLSVPRRLRFRDLTPDLEDAPVRETDRPVEVNEINRHLEALHLGTPGQKRPSALFQQVRSPRQPELGAGETRATLEELMRKDQEMKLLKKVKLKNTTVKGKVRELVRYGERMKISDDSVDSHILAEFGLHGGKKLAKTLEGLIPTNLEVVEQETFEEKWKTVGALSACQEVAEKGVGGILKHIFQGVKRNALLGAKEFLLYGPETSPEELEKALIRYDRKTEIIQTDREKSNNKPSRPKDQPRRSEREK
ncbi:hypothetical protein G5714_012197 [Onychostoma macrolepis]|uniref:Macro domain-containing protein n=1 Tax=Onychostoma macrolepis TaxID=369639 RepID=A0A7J6CFY4_9TELE|nr:hypothetical protein G5714_012197 [Onychostoma macrolepis]